MHKIEIPLDIPDIKIENVEIIKEGDIIITVKSTVKGTRCHKCGRKITKPHGHDQEITLRHLSILGRRVYIRIRPARYQCTHCNANPTTTQKLTWYEPRSPNTIAYEEHVLCELVHSTVSDVSIKEDLGYETVMGIIQRHIWTEVDWSEIERLDVIGIDEISLKKELSKEEYSKREAKRKIYRWKKRVIKSGLTCFNSFLATLDKCMDGITNYFINRQTTGFVEGFNNKIKVIKRRCYGILNVKHMFQRIYLDLEGYSLFA